MIAICYITNTSLDTDKFRVLSLVRYGKDDALDEVDEVSPWGIDSNAVNDIAAAHTTSSVMGEDVVLGYFIKEKKAARGETRVFSTNAGGEEQTRIWLHANGDIELGGTGDANSNTNHATQYEALKTAFDELKGDFNSLVQAYNSHVHVLTLSAGTGTAAPTATSGAPSAADVSGAKLSKIKVE